MKAEKPMIKKEAVKGISFGGDVKDEIEKAKILDEIKEKERFMFWEITTLDNIVDVRTMKLIVENSYKFLYCTTEKENDLYHHHRCSSSSSCHHLLDLCRTDQENKQKSLS